MSHVEELRSKQQLALCRTGVYKGMGTVIYSVSGQIVCTAVYHASFLHTQPALKHCISNLYLHRALNKVTQSPNQHMHTFNFLFTKTYLKFLKTLLHVSVIRPSPGSL